VGDSHSAAAATPSSSEAASEAMHESNGSNDTKTKKEQQTTDEHVAQMQSQSSISPTHSRSSSMNTITITSDKAAGKKKKKKKKGKKNNAGQAKNDPSLGDEDVPQTTPPEAAPVDTAAPGEHTPANDEVAPISSSASSPDSSFPSLTALLPQHVLEQYGLTNKNKKDNDDTSSAASPGTVESQQASNSKDAKKKQKRKKDKGNKPVSVSITTPQSTLSDILRMGSIGDVNALPFIDDSTLRAAGIDPTSLQVGGSPSVLTSKTISPAAYVASMASHASPETILESIGMGLGTRMAKMEMMKGEQTTKPMDTNTSDAAKSPTALSSAAPHHSSLVQKGGGVASSSPSTTSSSTASSSSSSSSFNPLSAFQSEILALGEMFHLESLPQHVMQQLLGEILAPFRKKSNNSNNKKQQKKESQDGEQKHNQEHDDAADDDDHESTDSPMSLAEMKEILGEFIREENWMDHHHHHRTNTNTTTTTTTTPEHFERTTEQQVKSVVGIQEKQDDDDDEEERARLSKEEQKQLEASDGDTTTTAPSDTDTKEKDGAAANVDSSEGVTTEIVIQSATSKATAPSAVSSDAASSCSSSTSSSYAYSYTYPHLLSLRFDASFADYYDRAFRSWMVSSDVAQRIVRFQSFVSKQLEDQKRREKEAAKAVDQARERLEEMLMGMLAANGQDHGFNQVMDEEVNRRSSNSNGGGADDDKNKHVDDVVGASESEQSSNNNVSEPSSVDSFRPVLPLPSHDHGHDHGEGEGEDDEEEELARLHLHDDSVRDADEHSDLPSSQLHSPASTMHGPCTPASVTASAPVSEAASSTSASPHSVSDHSVSSSPARTTSTCRRPSDSEHSSPLAAQKLENDAPQGPTNDAHRRRIKCL